MNSMPFFIDELSVEGLRGINRKLTLKMHEGVCLLYGRNGTGKTSVLQAIEWGLTGKFPYLSGPEFRYEDAIVNLFNPKKVATVSVTLKDEEGKKVVVTRRRKMYRSTTRGRAHLEIDTEGEVVRGTGAQERLDQVLGLKPEDFPKMAYLHQEAIRDLITAEPKERSKTIDRLLGTFELRELVEALDVRRTIRRETRNLQKRIETLERDKIVFVIRMRERLNQEKEVLVKKGYTEDQLTVRNVAHITSNAIEGVKAIAEKLSAPTPDIETPKLSSESISKMLDEVERGLKKLDRFRSTAYRQQEERRLNFENLKKQYEQAERELLELGKVTLDLLLKEKADVDGQIEKLDPELEDLQKRLNGLLVTKPKFGSALRQIEAYNRQIAEIRKRYGGEKQHLNSIRGLKAKLDELEVELRKFTALERIISLALEYLERIKPEECPVCFQPIEYEEVVKRLQKAETAIVSESINQLREKRDKTRKSIEEYEKSLKNYKDVKSRLSSEKEGFEAVKREIESIIGRPIDPSFKIDEVIESFKKGTFDLNTHITKLTKNSLELDQRYKTLKTCLQSLEEVQNRIQKTIKSSEVKKKLIQDLDEEIQKTMEQARYYEDTSAIDASMDQVAVIKELVRFLQSKEELAELEKELPQITRLVEDLRNRIVKLSELEGSLERIRQATIAHQMEATKTTLGAIEDLINRYFSGILGHPYFVKLQIKPEGEPIIYSIRGLSEDSSQSTHIPTRFSNTQMNIVALSLFLANNTKMAGNLGVLVMDDPTQSMDQEHKEALATIIRELSMNSQVIIATQDVELKNATGEICKDQLHTYEFTGWNTDELHVVSN